MLLVFFFFVFGLPTPPSTTPPKLLSSDEIQYLSCFSPLCFCPFLYFLLSCFLISFNLGSFCSFLLYSCSSFLAVLLQQSNKTRINLKGSQNPPFPRLSSVVFNTKLCFWDCIIDAVRKEENKDSTVLCASLSLQHNIFVNNLCFEKDVQSIRFLGGGAIFGQNYVGLQKQSENWYVSTCQKHKIESFRDSFLLCFLAKLAVIIWDKLVHTKMPNLAQIVTFVNWLVNKTCLSKCAEKSLVFRDTHFTWPRKSYWKWSNLAQIITSQHVYVYTHWYMYICCRVKNLSKNYLLLSQKSVQIFLVSHLFVCFSKNLLFSAGRMRFRKKNNKRHN